MTWLIGSGKRRKLNRPWLSPSGTAEGHFISGFTIAKLPICSAFCRVTGLRSRNSQTWPVKPFDTFDRGFSTAEKLFALGQLLKVLRWFMGQRILKCSYKPRLPQLRLEIIARWSPLPISMVLRSERSLKSKMPSLARTSKYVNDTSVLSINGQRRTTRSERTRQTG